MNFICTNENCSTSGQLPYNLSLKSESILDENNLGAFFCPHCQQVLQKDDTGSRRHIRSVA